MILVDPRWRTTTRRLSSSPLFLLNRLSQGSAKKPHEKHVCFDFVLRGEGRGHALRADVLVQLGSLYPVADMRTVFNQVSFLSANQKVTVTNVGQCLKLKVLISAMLNPSVA